MEAESFAAAVREARQRAGWSQSRLGAAADVPQSHIAKIESGADVRFSTVQRVMHALGYETAFRPVADSRASGIDIASLMRSFRMSPEQRLDSATSAANGLADLFASRVGV